MGHVSIDGTKIKANASKHKAMSYKHMNETEARLATAEKTPRQPVAGGREKVLQWHVRSNP